MSEEDNNSNKHSKPVTVLLSALLKRIKSKNLKNGFQEFPRKFLNKMEVWVLI